MPSLPGWSSSARDTPWLDLLIVCEADARAIEDALRQAVGRYSLRVHTGRRRDLDRLALPPMPTLIDLGWQDGDEVLVSRLRSRFAGIPVVALVDPWDAGLAGSLVRAGADYCLPGDSLETVPGRQLLDCVLSLYLAGQEAAEWKRRHVEATARFTNVIENNVDGMVIIDFAGTVRYANAAAHALFGVPNGRLVGRGFGSPVAEAAAEIELMLPSGSARLVEMRVTDTLWDQQPMRLASLRDISDRHSRRSASMPYGRRGLPVS